MHGVHIVVDCGHVRVGPARLTARAARRALDQKLDDQVPLDLTFLDETGRAVRLGDYFHDKPVILVLAYYRCPMLCTQVLNGLVRACWTCRSTWARISTSSPSASTRAKRRRWRAAKKKTYLERYGRPAARAAGISLTGKEDSIKRADATPSAFAISYDAQTTSSPTPAASWC